MTETVSAVPLELVHGLSPLIREDAESMGGRSPSWSSWRELLDRCADPGRRRELDRFAERTSELTSHERRGLADALDEVQVDSKRWLIANLADHRDLSECSLVILGGWYGVLPLLVNWLAASPPRLMRSIDMDETVGAAGERLIGALYDNIEYQTADVMALDYQEIAGLPDPIVVNTICEHLPDFAGWWERIPRGQFVVLQSNDYFPCPDHVNCVHDLDEFKAQAPMSETLFAGVLPLSLMKRFMLIGRR